MTNTPTIYHIRNFFAMANIIFVLTQHIIK